MDDSIGLACDVKWERDASKNRVVKFLIGTIQVVYATTMTGWHGNKSIGFTLTLDESRKTVNVSAPDAINESTARNKVYSVKLIANNLFGLANIWLLDKALARVIDQLELLGVSSAGGPCRDQRADGGPNRAPASSSRQRCCHASVRNATREG